MFNSFDFALSARLQNPSYPPKRRHCVLCRTRHMLSSKYDDVRQTTPDRARISDIALESDMHA